MSDGATYSIMTLLDMARVPIERRAAMVAELPALLTLVGTFIEALDAVEAPAEAYDSLLKSCEWVDDGLGELRPEVHAVHNGEVIESRSFTIPIGDGA